MAGVREEPRPAGVGTAGALYRKLSPGPARPALEVASHQRARISGAMIAAVAERGYGAVTVRELVRLAGVSTHTFYEHFGGKEGCLLSTYEVVKQRAARRIVAMQNDADSHDADSPARLRLASRALAEELARRPGAARLVLLEAPSSLAPSEHARMRRADGVFEAVAKEALTDAAGGVELPPLLAKGIVAGMARVARARLLEGRERELPELAEKLIEWALCFCSEALGALGRLGPAPAPARTALFDPGGAAADRAEEAPGDERALILAAVERLAADQGYRHLTVPRIRATAGVSRRSFDAHFTGVSDCFLAACELRAGRALAQAARAGAAAASWQGGVHRASVALCARIARQPAPARLVLAEIVAAGQVGMRCRERLLAAAAERLRAATPPAQRPGELAAEASAGAILGLLEHHVATGRAERLPRAAATLSLLALAPAIGAPAAVEAIREEELRMRTAPQRRPSRPAPSDRRVELSRNGNRHRGV